MSTLSTITIEGNNIQNGNSDSAGTAYSYTNLMYLRANALVTGNVLAAAHDVGVEVVSTEAQITNNIFQKIKSTGLSQFLKLTNSATQVHHNKFYRDASIIGSYISITGILGQRITDNYFDKSTVNGTSETLIAGSSTSDIIDRNANQMYYRPMSINAYTEHSAAVPTYKVLTTGAMINVAIFVNLIASNNNAFHQLLFNLSEKMSVGARLVGVDLGYNGNGTFNTASGNTTLTLALYRSNDLTSDIANSTGAIASILTDPSEGLDAINVLTDQITYSTSGHSNLTNGSIKHLKLVPDPGDPYVVTPTSDLILSLDLNAALSASSTASISYTLLIKYTYSYS